jgi:DNA repair exonuclease SbcCD ATPase subunit
MVGQRMHDLRLGPQRMNVDVERSKNNTIIAMATGFDARGMAWTRFADKHEKATAGRRVKKTRDDLIYRSAVISFSTVASAMLGANHPDEEALTAFKDYAERHQVELLWSIAHRDELSIHYHAMFTDIRHNGTKLTLRKLDLKREQDRMGEHFAHLGIRRGKARAERIREGALSSEIIHRTVRELHHDLPIELEAAKAGVQKVQGDLAKKADLLANTQTKLERARANEATAENALATLEARFATQSRRHEAAQELLTTVEATLSAKQTAMDSLASREAALERREASLDARELQAEEVLAECFDTAQERAEVRAKAAAAYPTPPDEPQPS